MTAATALCEPSVAQGPVSVDARILAELHRGDEAAFRSLVESHHSAMVLGLTEGNQRVLLHRARRSVSSSLEHYVSRHRRQTPGSCAG